jgi:bifunctional DNA-binding transcriptional regulator/antitoxin component of YhaV-PrlF toxin-antitoxin module
LYGDDPYRTSFHGYLTVQSRGTVALPSGLRRKYALDKPGAQVEITEREDGVLEIRPLVAVPATQAWFWTEDWQNREREVDAHLAGGEVTVHEDVDAFLGHLDALDAQRDDAAPATGEGEHVGTTR